MRQQRPGSRTGCAGGERREIIGAVDETFFERMMLVFMDLSTGYLLLEEVADDRTYATWKALVDERLKNSAPRCSTWSVTEPKPHPTR